jgi:O-antigen ligase
VLLGALEVSGTELFNERVANVNTIQMRFATYARVIEVGKGNPIFGIGLNNLRNVLHETFLRQQTLGTPHNSYIAIFAELGGIALVAYFLIMSSLARAGLRIFQQELDAKDRWRGAVLLGMLTAYLIPSLFTHLAYHPTLIHIYMFVCAGAITGRYNLVRLPAEVGIPYFKRHTEVVRSN